MLCISRRKGESFWITLNGTDVEVKVREVTTNGTIRFAIDAPRDVLILRDELRGKEKHGEG